jgi:twitching motility protein PilT
MAKIDQLFKIMFQQGASDLHLTSGSTPYLRLAGEMVKLAMKPLSNEEVQLLIFEILNEKQKRAFIENWELDCSYALDGLGRFRCNVFMQRKGMGAVFRMIPDKIKTAEELSLPTELLDLIKIPKGLICVTGPTGSGKSTTLAALIHYINENESAHIITIEDPIEFVHQNIKSLVNQREVGGHTKSFANALRAALREDPDIILVGEMRDLETIQLAITAAETGHLVFGTLHTSSAAKTVDRIIDVFPDTKQAQIRSMLSESLRGVIAQTLLQRQDGIGRVAAMEVMVNTKAIANLIREGKIHQIPSTMQMSRSSGCISYEQSIETLMGRGTISTLVGNEFLGRGSGEKADKVLRPPVGAPQMPSMQQPPASDSGTNGGANAQTSSASGLGTPPSGSPNPPTAPGGALSNFASRFKKTS